MWRTSFEVSLVDETVKTERFGDVVLFFGNRNRSHDFLYETELVGYVSDQTLTCLHTAFSRDQVTCVVVNVTRNLGRCGRVCVCMCVCVWICFYVV